MDTSWLDSLLPASVKSGGAHKEPAHGNGPHKHAPHKSVPIRSLGPRQRPAILRHILALDEHDRYLRFGYAANNDHIAKYVANLHFERDEIYGIYNRKLELIAMAHLAFNPSPSMKHQVEFGVSVSKTARGKGMGAQLFERALLHARNEGAIEMVIHALSENTAMLKIATNAGSKVVRDGSESEAHLSVPPATFASQVGELVDEHVGEFDYNFKMQAKNLNDLIHDLTHPAAKAD